MKAQLANIVLVIVVVFSSMGFALDRHYCMGELQSMSILGSSKTCHQKAQSGCANHTNNGTDGEGCCNNKTEFIDGIDLQVTFGVKIERIVKVNILPFCTKILETFDTEPAPKLAPFKNFHPPPAIKDITVFVQSFLL